MKNIAYDRKLGGQIIISIQTIRYGPPDSSGLLIHAIYGKENMFDNANILITGGTGSFGKKYTETILKRYSP